MTTTITSGPTGVTRMLPSTFTAAPGHVHLGGTFGAWADSMLVAEGQQARMTLGEEVMSDRAEISVGISSHEAARLLRQR
jgi:hypothetical protein